MKDAAYDESLSASSDGVVELEHFYFASTASTGVGSVTSYDWLWLASSGTSSAYYSSDDSSGSMSNPPDTTYPESLSTSVSTSVNLDPERPNLQEANASTSVDYKDMESFMQMRSWNGSANDLSDTSWELPLPDTTEADAKNEHDVHYFQQPPPTTSAHYVSHEAPSGFEQFQDDQAGSLENQAPGHIHYGSHVHGFGLGVSQPLPFLPAAGPALQASIMHPSNHSIYSSGLGPRGLAVPHNSPNNWHQFDELAVESHQHPIYASTRSVSDQIHSLHASQQQAFLTPSGTVINQQRLSAPPQLALESEPHHFTPPLRPTSSNHEDHFHGSTVDQSSSIFQAESLAVHQPRPRYDHSPIPFIVPSMEDDGAASYDQTSQFADVDSSQALSHTPYQSERSDSAGSAKGKASLAVRQKRPKRSDSLRAGGRKRGSHLADNTKANAREMRDVVSCWRCVFQRDKRMNRARTNGGLGCDRTRLMDLSLQFLPGLGPPIVCTVYEFTATSPELAEQAQYKTNMETGRSERIVKRSPPLALFRVQDQDARVYERFLDECLRRDIASLPRKFFEEETDDFPERLLQLMVDFYDEMRDTKHYQLLGQILRLILITYVMGRTLTFTQSTSSNLLSWLSTRHYLPIPHDPFTSPRMANRQLKYLFSLLHKELLTNLLNKLQQILHSSNVRGNWIPAFLCLLGFAISQEDTQRTVYIIMDDRWHRGELLGEHAGMQADTAAAAVDDKFAFLVSLFTSKFNKSLNPLWDSAYEHMTKWIGEREMRFVREVRALVDEKRNYLEQRKRLPLTPETQTLATSRLLARFLLGIQATQ
ncbi:MAG: hypothetical protein M1820_006699 [Bogoriella megaspora]|nr:MAG: hypothetical protein M1820_006699 [Bogoriella megaspora]